MSTGAIIFTAAVAGSVLLVAWVWIAERLDQPPRGRHNPFADPADRDDPHGDQYIARLTADGNPGPDLAALTPSPVGGGWLAPLPDDDPADTTGVQPVAICELGAPVDQYLADLFPSGGGELFDKHAEATP